jgi:superfamily II DNA/RNA helicase
MLFKQLYLSSQLQSSLERNNFEKLTNIQEKVLPTTLARKSVIITSNTGTGKTLCYVLPILNNLNEQTTNLVVVPTKELARQVYSSFLLLASKNNIQLVIGDNNNQARLQTIKHQKPDVIVTTPL